jgi:tRNA A37 threonylcarbamoyladenosine synthetase subunit TsaC/SUA5/YrdC
MIEHRVLLAQTDTTVGFLSQDQEQLNRIKQRPRNKSFLVSFADFKTFKAQKGRIPARFKVQVRRSKGVTYVVKNRAFRVIHEPFHRQLLLPYGWLYSTSANLSGHPFERSFAEAHSDIVIEDRHAFKENPPSSIIKLSNRHQKRLR